ncbi:YitT family protein [Jeotgalibacillus sp. S-D1]|uniref:YczE/YyaS/YitT family protein n=1 Tax=Jeotgalibacillus sp. S-D1 TaxID=2552189 RepID=UPI00140496BF|nr:membrane protein [Jeotgalibacillus sp. S-D1]
MLKTKVTLGLFYTIGLVLLSFGISMMILADLGAGPWDALYVALADILGFTVGTWILIVGFLLILLNAFLLKRMPDFFAVITIFIMGFFIDFWLLFAFADLIVPDTGSRIAMLAGSILIIAAGVSLYLQANFAPNPIDGLMMAVNVRTGLSLSKSKTVLEVAVMVIALIIGGPIGVGTVIVAFGIGPLIQLFFVPVSKIKSKMVLAPDAASK